MLPADPQLMMQLFQSLSALAHDRTSLQAYHSKLCVQAHALAHDEVILETHLSLAQDLVRALIDKRLDISERLCASILASYAEQARHYMSQQAGISEASRQSTDPLVRADCSARLVQLDIELQRIRSDCRRLFQDMTRAMTAFGVAIPQLPNTERRLLQL